MTETTLIYVAGTWAGNPAWIEDPAHPFQQMMTAQGFKVARSKRTGLPYRWPTSLGGLPFINRGIWDSSADELIAFCDDFPYADLNFFGHSHGGNVILKALARMHRRARTNTTISTPVRKDVPAAAAAANVDYWQHVFDPERDWIGTLKKTLGAVGDGDVSLERKFLIPGVQNHGMPGVRHSRVLEGREGQRLIDLQVLEGIRHPPVPPRAA